MRKIFCIFLLLSITTNAYQLGRGLKLIDTPKVSLNLGGHLSLDYSNYSEFNTSQTQSLNLQEVGLMAYGTIANQFSYLAEIGNDNAYSYNLEHNDMYSEDLELKRLYGSYEFSDSIKIKLGRFLTPIGIWNPTYINALRDTTVRPFVATAYYPDIITGVQVSGFLDDNQEFEYALFKQLKAEEQESVSKIPTTQFIGTELRYHFDLASRIALVAGNYHSQAIKEEVNLLGFNAKFELEESELSLEFLNKDAKWKEDKWQEISWYVQYVQQLKEEHSTVLRIGEQKHLSSWESYELLLGHNYQPLATISIKTEGRYIKRIGLNSFDSNQLFISLSVLF